MGEFVKKFHHILCYFHKTRVWSTYRHLFRLSPPVWALTMAIYEQGNHFGQLRLSSMSLWLIRLHSHVSIVLVFIFLCIKSIRLWLTALYLVIHSIVSIEDKMKRASRSSAETEQKCILPCYCFSEYVGMILIMFGFCFFWEPSVVTKWCLSHGTSQRRWLDNWSIFFTSILVDVYFKGLSIWKSHYC